MATFGEMLTRIKFGTGIKSGSDSNGRQNLKEAIRHIVATLQPQETWKSTTFSTSNATAEYDFETDLSITSAQVYAIMYVRNDTDDEIIKRGGLMHYNRLPQDTSNSSNLGKPNRWTRRQNKIILYSKIPDSTTRTIDMTYLEIPSELAETDDATFDADTFPLNDEWIKPVELYATALFWNDLNSSNFSLKMAAYNDMLTTRPKPEQIEDLSPEASLEMMVMD